MANCVILNPNAGSAVEFEEVKELLSGIRDLNCLQTTNEGHAISLAREAIQSGTDLLIAAGGDGTLSEILNGMTEGLDSCKLGVYPMGTGNDFARSVYTSLQREDVVRALRAGNTRYVDIMKMISPVERLGINAVGGGFGAQLSANLGGILKQWFGSAAYAVKALNTIRDLDVYSMKITLDDDEPVEMKAINIVISNGQMIGGGVPIAPKAKLDDGLLDVTVFPHLPPEELLTLLPTILSPEGTEDERLFSRRARRIVVESDPLMPFNIDGEVVGEGRLEIEVIPGAVQMIVDPIVLDLEVKEA